MNQHESLIKTEINDKIFEKIDKMSLIITAGFPCGEKKFSQPSKSLKTL